MILHAAHYYTPFSFFMFILFNFINNVYSIYVWTYIIRVKSS